MNLVYVQHLQTQISKAKHVHFLKEVVIRFKVYIYQALSHFSYLNILLQIFYI